MEQEMEISCLASKRWMFDDEREWNAMAAMHTEDQDG